MQFILKYLSNLIVTALVTICLVFVMPVYAGVFPGEIASKADEKGLSVQQLGPLKHFQGIWYGTGWNLIAVPIKRTSGTQTNCVVQENGRESFCVHVSPYCEKLDVSQAVQIANKFFPENIDVFGLNYEQQVIAPAKWVPGDSIPPCPDFDNYDKEKFKNIHVEKGSFLYLGDEKGQQSITRLFSLASGNTVLAMGQAQSVNLTEINKAPGFPVVVGTVRPGYNAPYEILEKTLRGAFSVKNPNQTLSNSFIKGKAMELDLSTNYSGGSIASIPFFDKRQPAEGAFQIPKFKSTFWIQNINNPNKLQLQYSQRTDLDFLNDRDRNLIMWPHVNVATLCKDAYCPIKIPVKTAE